MRGRGTLTKIDNHRTQSRRAASNNQHCFALFWGCGETGWNYYCQLELHASNSNDDSQGPCSWPIPFSVAQRKRSILFLSDVHPNHRQNFTQVPTCTFSLSLVFTLMKIQRFQEKVFSLRNKLFACFSIFEQCLGILCALTRACFETSHFARKAYFVKASVHAFHPCEHALNKLVSD